MTDVHCHVTSGDPEIREFLIGREFIGIHPWETRDNLDSPAHLDGLDWLESLRARLDANAALGVGEIGLDRLKEKTVSPLMREVFEAQLKLALDLNRPVVLHGAKCWGQVVGTVLKHGCRARGDGCRCLFHGFSRSDGLIPDIVKLGGYISVGPAVLNDHAVNYRELVKKIPHDRLLVETDRTESSEPVSVREVLAKTAEIRGQSAAELEAQTDENATRFIAFTSAHLKLI